MHIRIVTQPFDWISRLVSSTSQPPHYLDNTMSDSLCSLLGEFYLHSVSLPQRFFSTITPEWLSSIHQSARPKYCRLVANDVQSGMWRLSISKAAGAKGNRGEHQLCGQTQVLETTQNILRYTTVDRAMIISEIRLHLDLRDGLYLAEQTWLGTSSVNRNYEAYGDDGP